MAKLGTAGLTKLIQLIKTNTVSSTDVEQCTEVTIDSTPTASSTNLVTSGGVSTALADKVDYSDIVNDVTTGGTTKALSAEQGKTLNTSLTTHTGNTSNPHSVTKAQVGLGNVPNIDFSEYGLSVVSGKLSITYEI